MSRRQALVGGGLAAAVPLLPGMRPPRDAARGENATSLLATRQGSGGVPGFDPAETRARTEEVLATLRRPARIPDHFNALRASDAALVHYGLPPRPDRDLLPAHYAQWERALSQPVWSVVPEFSITGVVHLPIGPAATGTSPTSSGAVLLTPPPNETFNKISARWIVPNAWPPPSARNGSGWNDGTYICSTWVGIDGVNGIQELLQGGTASVAVVSGGQITSQRSWAWLEWFPAGSIAFSNFTANPGDLVHFLVCGASDNTHGYVTVLNECSRQTTNATITAPGTSQLAGMTAEWFTEDPTNGNTGQVFPLPNYGAAFFYDALAGSQTQERNLSDAVLVNMVSGGSTLSSAAQENQSALLTYFGTEGP
jgi:hypothetical protein